MQPVQFNFMISPPPPPPPLQQDSIESDQTNEERPLGSSLQTLKQTSSRGCGFSSSFVSLEFDSPDASKKRLFESEQLDETNELQQFVTTSPLPPLVDQRITSAFGEVCSLADYAGIRLETPTFVFVGPRSHGKSALIEAIVGHLFQSTMQFGREATKRPLHIELVYTPDQSSAQFHLTPDIPSMDMAHTSTEPEKIMQIVHTRNEIDTDEPIYMRICADNILNLTLIDTPGLLLTNSATASVETMARSEAIEDVVLNLIRPLHTHIVCVEETQHWKHIKMLQFIRQVDPLMARSTFVFTKLSSFLRNAFFGNASTSAIDQYFRAARRHTNYNRIPAFFVSVPSNQVRRAAISCGDVSLFQKRVFQVSCRDDALLDQLSYGKRCDETARRRGSDSARRMIGIVALRRHIFSSAWKSLQQCLPKIEQLISAKLNYAQRALDQLAYSSQAKPTLLFRKTASSLTHRFVDLLHIQIEGSSEPLHFAHGQTVHDEILSSERRNAWLGQKTSSFSTQSSPLFILGGHQFSRLIQEFREVASQLKMKKLHLDEIVNSIWQVSQVSATKYLYASIDLARQFAHNQFSLLLDHLCVRSKSITTHLAHVAMRQLVQEYARQVSLLQQNTLKDGNQQHLTSKQYAYVLGRTDAFSDRLATLMVEHLFHLVDTTLAKAITTFRTKVLDDFFATETIVSNLSLFSLQQDGSTIPPSINQPEKVHAFCQQQADAAFDSIKHSLERSVSLKFYNFLVTAFQSSIYSDIAKDLSLLDAHQLNTIFSQQKSQNKEENLHQSFDLAKKHLEQLHQLSQCIYKLS
mmetsp:Transcript_17985/g.26779  ORF Transcript_17985/g.26779 Transcript_17985/m.26779 type:complete len:807 (+) Transcript_17985:358-2778(+)